MRVMDPAVPNRILLEEGNTVKFLAKLDGAYERICFVFSSFVLDHPKGYMAVTALLGAFSFFILLVPDAGAQLEQQVTEALNPLARLLVGPIAKGLAVIGLFSFVGFLYAGKWLIAISSLVAAVILGLLANIVTAIFQGSSASSFTLGP